MACLPANPDISGIGVRTAIYAQNLLCFLPVVAYLWDKKISPDELAGVRDQSVGMLAVAFSILITTVILAKGPGSEGPTISSYHAAIVLDLSWMNNTSTWIWFILFVHHKSKIEYKPADATWSTWWDLLWSPIAGFLQGEGGTGNGGEQTGIRRFFLRLCYCSTSTHPRLHSPLLHGRHRNMAMAQSCQVWQAHPLRCGAHASRGW